MVRVCLLALVFLCVFPCVAFAETLCGMIDVPTTLTADKSPYLVTGDVQITPTGRLTLEAGTVLLIVPGEACGESKQMDWNDSGAVSIKVFGGFLIKGKPEAPVRILPQNHQPGKIQWDGIRFYGRTPEQVQIEYLQIAGANQAIFAQKSGFNVANALFLDNNTGARLDGQASVAIFNSLFTQNLSAGVYISEARPVLIANLFYKNNGYGVWSDSRPSPRIENNLFFAGGDVACYKCPVGAEGKNIFKDPLFLGSAEALKKLQNAPGAKTPITAVKDTTLYRLYATADSLGKTGIAPPPQFVPLGVGEWRLSQFSPALDAAPESDFWQDTDGTRGDLGLWGGKPGRASQKVP
jgi:hypothetical protein